MRSIERRFFKCKEIDSSEYPLVPEEDFLYMQSESVDATFVHIFPFVRIKDEEFYIDIYAWDISLSESAYSFKRFVLRNGYGLSEEDEKALLEYLHTPSMADIDEQCADAVGKMVERAFALWNYYHGMYDNPEQMLEHFYYAAISSGPRGILIKSGLSRIALALDIIPYNMIGKTPEEIIGLPLKLLEFFNASDRTMRWLIEEEKLVSCNEAYKAYLTCFEKDVPSMGQMLYLIQLQETDETVFGRRFHQSMYNCFKTVEDEKVFQWYIDFIVFRNYLGEMSPIVKKMGFPAKNEVRTVIQKLLYAIHYLNGNNSILDELFRERKKRGRLEDNEEMEKYLVILPNSIFDVCVDALRIGHCLMLKGRNHAFSETTILFVRRKSAPEIPFLTMEVYDGRIAQVYRKEKSRLPSDAFPFLERYAERMHINPPIPFLKKKSMEKSD